MADLISIGITALRANQAKLTTTSHNIANAGRAEYSRQEVIVNSLAPQSTGSGFFGNGVSVDGVRRSVSELAISELRAASSELSRSQYSLQSAERIDATLSEADAGLTGVMQRFFDSMQQAAESPSSLANRQIVMDEGNQLSQRFNSLNNFLDEQQQSLNKDMKASVKDLNSLLGNMSEINRQISSYQGNSINNMPNDLLDERDAILRDISSMLSISIVAGNESMTNVFTSSGQPLVLGTTTYEVGTQISTDNAEQLDLTIVGKNSNQVISDSISGGTLGGLIEFRENVLNPSYNQLGRLAITIADQFNAQHKLGLTLNNDIGGFVFSDINSDAAALGRSVVNADNSDPTNQQVRVNISDTTQLTTSDYLLEFPQGNPTAYTVTRLSDNTKVAEGTFNGTYPSTVEFDGLEVSIEAGDFAAGDKITLFPTREGAALIDFEIENARDLALAQPTRTVANQTNRGSAKITAETVLDTTTPFFTSDPGNLNPPLIVRFTSATTYDVLDNSDPNNPTELLPPLNGLRFSPGVTNNLLPVDDGSLGVRSDGSAMGFIQRNAVSNTYTNSVASESFRLTNVDPDTGSLTSSTFNSAAGDSAKDIAAVWNAQEGVTASARTKATLSNVNSSTPMIVTLNGQNFSVSTATQLAADINSNTALAGLGIKATSDGDTIELLDANGEDLNISITGGASDSVLVTAENGSDVLLTGNDAIPEATISGVVDLVLEEGSSVRGQNSVFSLAPTASSRFLGMQLSMSGNPIVGDEFKVEFNNNGAADNRNALALSELQTKKILDNAGTTLQDDYGSLVDYVGVQTRQSKIKFEASLVVVEQAQARRDEISGVNLEEEAGKILQYEQAYNAAAQLVSVARSLFDTLLNAMR
ncbi:MAG: flagellar hook-associated protein FlgK [Pseudomonadota bacterium]